MLKAQPTALIGSIGVIMQTLNVQGLSEKIGVTDTTIKSGKNKDLLNPFHAVDPEQVALMKDIQEFSPEQWARIKAESARYERGYNPTSSLIEGL